jgi:hypothetical protein
LIFLVSLFLGGGGSNKNFLSAPTSPPLSKIQEKVSERTHTRKNLTVAFDIKRLMRHSNITLAKTYSGMQFDYYFQNISYKVGSKKRGGRPKKNKERGGGSFLRPPMFVSFPLLSFMFVCVRLRLFFFL